MTCVKDIRAILARRRCSSRVKPQCQPHQSTLRARPFLLIKNAFLWRFAGVPARTLLQADRQRSNAYR